MFSKAILFACLGYSASQTAAHAQSTGEQAAWLAAQNVDAGGLISAIGGGINKKTANPGFRISAA